MKPFLIISCIVLIMLKASIIPCMSWLWVATPIILRYTLCPIVFLFIGKGYKCR